MMDYYLNLSKNEEIQYRRRKIKNILILIFYYLWDLFYFYFMYGMEILNYLSISLSANQNMKSEIRMGSGLIKNDKNV